MKIEKISNTQIKVILSRRDLEERNLKFTEIASVSDKTRELFKEMMEEAVREFGFTADNIPLMIEAVPIGNDEIMLLVSKVDSEEPAETALNIVPMALRDRLFVRKRVEELPEEIVFGDGRVSLYSFEHLDEVSALCAQLKTLYEGKSSLYKENGVYYLVLSADFAVGISAESFDSLVSEYGVKHISNAMSKAYLEEHAEVIVDGRAVEVLAEL